MKRYDFAKVFTKPRPTVRDLDNKWIFGGIKCVINVSTNSTVELLEEYRRRGIEYHFLPLMEEVSDLGWGNYKLAVTCLLKQIANDAPTIVHCECGNHRSPLVVEGAYYALYGQQMRDEYKGSLNHLLYDLENNHFPLTTEAALQEIAILRGAGKENIKALIREKADHLLVANNVPMERARKIRINLDAFLSQAWYDEQLLDTEVVWSDEWQEIIILWNNYYSDNEFCIGQNDYSWHTWCGENHHRQDDVRYGFGLGGDEINESNMGDFAHDFYEQMDSGYDYVLNIER